MYPPSRRIVEPWVSWAVFALAMKHTNDVMLAVRTAQAAIADLWDE